MGARKALAWKGPAHRLKEGGSSRVGTWLCEGCPLVSPGANPCRTNTRLVTLASVMRPPLSFILRMGCSALGAKDTERARGGQHMAISACFPPFWIGQWQCKLSSRADLSLSAKPRALVALVRFPAERDPQPNARADASIKGRTLENALWPIDACVCSTPKQRELFDLHSTLVSADGAHPYLYRRVLSAVLRDYDIPSSLLSKPRGAA